MHDKQPSFLSPLFIISTLVVAAAVAALPAALSAVTEHFTKLPAPIRVSLHDFDFNRMPNFRQVVKSREFGIMEDQDIGTDEAFMVSMQKVDALGEPISRETLFHAAYYDGAGESGLRVSHTPEVCYRQGGATINDVQRVDIPLPAGAIPGYDSIPARMVDITLPGGGYLIDVYLFVSNGNFYHDREALRFAMSVAGEPRVYFTKVEAGALYDREKLPGRPHTTREEARDMAMEVLAEGLPILLEHHLPQPEDLHAPEEVIAASTASP